MPGRRRRRAHARERGRHEGRAVGARAQRQGRLGARIGDELEVARRERAVGPVRPGVRPLREREDAPPHARVRAEVGEGGRRRERDVERLAVGARGALRLGETVERTREGRAQRGREASPRRSRGRVQAEEPARALARAAPGLGGREEELTRGRRRWPHAPERRGERVDVERGLDASAPRGGEERVDEQREDDGRHAVRAHGRRAVVGGSGVASSVVTRVVTPTPDGHAVVAGGQRAEVERPGAVELRDRLERLVERGLREPLARGRRERFLEAKEQGRERRGALDDVARERRGAVRSVHEHAVNVGAQGRVVGAGQRRETRGAARELSAREGRAGARERRGEGGPPEARQTSAHPDRGWRPDERRSDVGSQQPVVDEQQEQLVGRERVAAARGATHLLPRRPTVGGVEDRGDAVVELGDTLLGEGLGGREPSHGRRGAHERGRDAQPDPRAERLVVEERAPQRRDPSPRSARATPSACPSRRASCRRARPRTRPRATPTGVARNAARRP